MASASYKVEHNGSAMYDTPRILVQLGECDVCVATSCQECVFSIQPANSPDTKAHDSLHLSDHTLADLGLNQGGIPSTIWAVLDQSVPTQGCQNVMCATQEDDVSPRWRYASKDVNLYSQNSAHGYQLKGG